MTEILKPMQRPTRASASVKALCTVILVLMMCSTQAQEFKCDSSTCTIKHNGIYKIELAGCHNYLDIYVYDETGHSIKNSTIQGVAEFFYLDETTLSSPFTQFFKTHSLRAKIPVSGFYNCRGLLDIHGETVSVYFDNECDRLPLRH